METTLETTLPILAKDVLQSNLFDLMEKCEELDIPQDNCSTVEHFRERIIGHMKQVYGKAIKAVPPVNTQICYVRVMVSIYSTET